jgi:hypothetical protein
MQQPRPERQFVDDGYPEAHDYDSNFAALRRVPLASPGGRMQPTESFAGWLRYALRGLRLALGRTA